MYFYSAKTGGFYPAEIKNDYINAGNFPDDCISVEDDVFIEFAGSKPPDGKQCGSDKEGLPTWIDIVESYKLTSDQLATLARRYRDDFIVATDPVIVRDYTIGDIELAEEKIVELAAVRRSYKTWPKQSQWPLIELPYIPQWLLTEAVNHGYIMPIWPPEGY